MRKDASAGVRYLRLPQSMRAVEKEKECSDEQRKTMMWMVREVRTRTVRDNKDPCDENTTIIQRTKEEKKAEESRHTGTTNLQSGSRPPNCDYAQRAACARSHSRPRSCCQTHRWA